MRPTLLTLLLASALALPRGARAEIVDGIAVVVNGDVITLSELAERVGPLLPPADATGEAKERRHRLLEQAAEDAIAEKLLAHEAKSEGLVPTEAEIDNAVNDVKSANHIDDETLKKALAQQGLTPHRYREMLKAQLTRMKVVQYKVKNQVSVSEDEVKARYEKMAATMPAKREIHARDIYLPGGSDPAATKAKLAAARARVVAGTPFAQVARELGGPLGPSGGDLGWFSQGMMLPALERVAFALQPGQVSQVFEAGGGFHLVYLEGQRESGGAKPLAEARAEIRSQLLQEKLEKATTEYVAQLRRDADVELHLP